MLEWSETVVGEGEAMRDATQYRGTHAARQATHMQAATADRPKEETARLGDEIYERDIRRQVEAEHHGDIVAIDVDSGQLGHRLRRS